MEICLKFQSRNFLIVEVKKMIKIKIDSFILFDVNHNTIYIFTNREDYETALEYSSRFRELNDQGQFLPVHFITDLYRAFKKSVDFYLVEVGSRLILREWGSVAPDVVLTVED